MRISQRWIFVVLLSVFIRLPRHLGIFGIDGLFLMWEARRLLDGSLFETMIHPTSYLGMYPFSGYPIGSIIITAFFLIIALQNVYVAILLFNVTMIILSVTFSKYYFDYIFKNEKIAYMAAFLYVNASPIFQFSYTNISARLPFMVIYPLIILSLTKIIEEGNKKEVGKLVLLSFLSLTFHRMSMVLLAIILPTILLWIVNRFYPDLVEYLAQKTISNQRILAVYLVIVSCMSFVVARVLNIRYRHFKTPFELDSALLDYVFIIPSQLYQNFGIILLLSLFTVFLLVQNKGVLDRTKIVSIMIQTSLILLLANIIYIFYLIIPLIVLLATIFIEYGLEEKHIFGRSIIGMGIVVWTGQVLISLFLIDLTFQVIISTIILVGSIVTISKNNLDNIRLNQLFNPLLIILILLMSMNSIFMLDFSIYYNKGDAPYRTGEISTSDAHELAEWFETQPKATVWGYSRLLTARVALFADWLLFDDLHGISFVIEDYYSTDQLENSQLKPPQKWWQAYIYDIPYNNSRDVHAQIMAEFDIDNPGFRNNITIVNVPYFIGYQNSNMSETYGGVWVESPLIQSFMDNNVEIIHSVNNFVIYDLRPYFN